jgi:hypothetical protein
MDIKLKFQPHEMEAESAEFKFSRRSKVRIRNDDITKKPIHILCKE